MNLISSKDNPIFKKISKLDKSRERRNSGLFVVEGKKEIIMAIESGYEFESLILEENTQLDDSEMKILSKVSNQIRFSNNLFKKIAYRNELSECVGICKIPIPIDLNDIKLSENEFVVVLESIEKPGNLGAVLRTADASGAAAVIVCEERCDFFNPNVIRSSVGTVFSVKKVPASKNEVVEWLLRNKIKTFTTFIENANPYYKADFKQSCAMVLGTEATGLTDFWRHKDFENIIIPMYGQNDSLNISVAASILMFEAKRQKMTNKLS